MSKFRSLVVFLAALLVPGVAVSGGTEDFGDYRVHYNAIATDRLAADVASAYGIVRSKSRAMLNISITKDVPGTTGISVPGKVKVVASNLTGQVKDLNLRKVEETGDYAAIYYIGEVSVSNGETLRFDITVTPEGSGESYSISFQQQFFTE
ncbi:MAG: DUF4426 domain-containing protein [Gammaproteobacteria bacterium]|nr:DUF4426 domain-containing protein [Gammaproteobacteria bacterium]